MKNHIKKSTAIAALALDKTLRPFRRCGWLLALVAVVAAFGFGGYASAATQYFSGTGTWNTATADWGNVTGGPYTATWVSGNSAVFEGSAGTVTMAATLPTVAGVTFGVDGYTITNSTLTIGASGLTLNGNTTINSALALSAAQAWPAGTAGKVLTLGGNLSSSAGNSAMNLSGCPMIKIGANQTWTQSSGGSPWTCGTVDLNGQTLTISKAGGTSAGAATLSLAGLTGSGTVSVQNPNAGSVHGICKINGNNTGFTGTVELKTADVTGQIILGGGANTLGNTTSTFTTTTTGTLDVTAATTLAATVAQNWNADWTFKGTASLNLGAGAVTLGGNRTLTVTASTLTVGAIGDGANTYSLTKGGAGTLALNAANTYHGATIINAGTLEIAPAGSLANSAITVNNTGTLQVDSTGKTLTSLTVADGSTLVPAATAGQTTTVSGALTLSGTPAFTVSPLFGSVPATGTYNLLTAGSVSGTAGTITTGGQLANSRFTGSTVLSGNTLQLTVAGGPAQSKTWNLSGDGTWDTSTANWTGGSDSLFQNWDAVTFDSSVTPGIITVSGTVYPGSVTMANTGDTYTFQTGVIAGPGSLTMSGAGGTLSLNTANTYTGGTTISAGTVNAGNNAAFGTGAINLNGGTLGFSVANVTLANALVATAATSSSITWANTATLNGTLTGSGSLNTVGTFNNLYLLGAMSGYSGAITIDVTSKPIWLAKSDKTASSNTGSTAAAFTVTGSGSALTLNRGTFNMGSLAGDGVITVPNIADTCILSVGGLNTPTIFSGTLNNNASGILALTKVGSGTLTLSGANTYTGNTTISAGTLTLDASGSIGSTNITDNGTFDVSAVSYHLTTGMTLSGTGTVTGPLTVDSGATLTVGGASGTTMGTLTVNGGLTLNGTNTLRLNKGGTPTSDKITGSGPAFGGTLNLSSVGTTLAAGDTFTIFAAGGTGSFATISPVTPGAGLVWDTSALNTSGVIGVRTPAATITAPATFPAAVSTTYGTASSPQHVAISGANLTADITATAPAGLEVSSDGTTYGPTATFTQSGGGASGTLYVRLTATATVAGSPYNSKNVTLTSLGCLPVNVATTSSSNTVTPLALTLTGATAQNKIYDGTTAAIITGGTLNTVVNSDVVTATSGNFAQSTAGTGIAVTVALGGADAGNYTLTQPAGLTAAILASAVWNGAAADSLWDTAGNWQESLIGSGFQSTADFSTLDITSDTAVYLSSPRIIKTLIFGDTDTNTAANWILANDGHAANTLTVSSVTVNALGTGMSATISALVVGTGGLTKTGNGTLTLSGANTYSGATLVNAGTLDVEGHSTTDTGNIFTVAQGATLMMGYNNSIYYGPVITINGNGVSDPAGLYVAGGRLLYLAALGNGLDLKTAPSTVRAYGSGTATLNPGYNQSVIWSEASASGSIIDADVNINVNNSHGQTFQADAGVNTATGDLTVSGLITGGNGTYANATIAKTGTGSLKLTAANDFVYNGISTVNLQNGSVILSGAGNLPATTVLTLGSTTNSGVLILGDSNGGVSQTLASLRTSGTGTANAVVGGSSALSTLTINNGNNITNNAILGGAGANQNNLALVMSGTGILTLGGANTYTGNTTINAGTLEIVHPVISPGSTVTVAAGAVLQLDFSTANQVKDLVLNGVSQPTGTYNSVNGAPYLTGPGSLLVSSVNLTPTNIVTSVSGGNLTLTWPADHTGWRLLVQTNHLTAGISSNTNDWTEVLPTLSGTNQAVLPISRAKPTEFYRLIYP